MFRLREENSEAIAIDMQNKIHNTVGPVVANSCGIFDGIRIFAFE